MCYTHMYQGRIFWHVEQMLAAWYKTPIHNILIVLFLEVSSSKISVSASIEFFHFCTLSLWQQSYSESEPNKKALNEHCFSTCQDGSFSSVEENKEIVGRQHCIRNKEIQFMLWQITWLLWLSVFSSIKLIVELFVLHSFWLMLSTHSFPGY